MSVRTSSRSISGCLGLCILTFYAHACRSLYMIAIEEYEIFYIADLVVISAAWHLLLTSFSIDSLLI